MGRAVPCPPHDDGGTLIPANARRRAAECPPCLSQPTDDRRITTNLFESEVSLHYLPGVGNEYEPLRMRGLIFRSLRFYARSHLGSVLGVAVAGSESGSATQEVSVSELASLLGLALGLALLLGLGLLELLVLGLGEAAPSFAPLARAVAGSPARTPTVREPPASTLSTAARRCARRMKKTALSSLLIEVTVCSSCDSEATR